MTILLPNIFDQTGIKNALLTLAEHCVTAQNTIDAIQDYTLKKIETFEPINCNTLSTYNIFSNNTTKKYCITDILLTPSSVISATAPPEINVKIGSNVIVPNTLLTGFLNNSKFWNFKISNLSTILQLNDILQLEIITASTASTFELKSIIYGFYI